MKIAVPSEDQSGLKSAPSAHFGHCAAFTLIDIEKDAVQKVSILPNMGHVQGGCMGPVMLLKNAGVNVLMAGGMGPRPLTGFQEVGIDVYFDEGVSTVEEAVKLFIAKKARKFGQAHVCGGGGDSDACGGGEGH